MAVRILSMLGLFCMGLSACTGGSDDTGTAGAPVDLDEDGFDSSVDCDDTDASVYPGAEDVWYDDIDSDCAGDDDHDADGDGVAAESSGGADCDDENPEVLPGATETWYDGIDSDCRGNDDYDQDYDHY